MAVALTACGSSASSSAGPHYPVYGATPDGKVLCAISPRYARCKTTTRSWQTPTHAPSCGSRDDLAIELNRSGHGSRAHFTCWGASRPRPPTYAPNTSFQTGRISCKSLGPSMRCSVLGSVTGQRFTISPTGYKLD